MALEFLRVSQAIEYTLSFYQIDRIKEYMFKFADKVTVKVNDTSTGYSSREWHEIVIGLQDRMDDEITQHMVISNSVAQAYLFNTLESWVNDYRFESVWLPDIVDEIDKYNNRIYEEFLLKVESDEEKFKANENYSKYNHLDKIPIVHKAGGGLIGLMRRASQSPAFEYTTEDEYRRFIIAYCPPLIDTAFLEQYASVVKQLIDHFKWIVSKQLSIYKSTKSNVSQLQIENSNLHIQQPSVESKKLKTKLSVDQLAYLFQLLKEEGIITTETNVEISEFISEHFETPRTANKKISATKFAISMSSPDSKIVKSLIPLLRSMQDKAAKF